MSIAWDELKFKYLCKFEFMFQRITNYESGHQLMFFWWEKKREVKISCICTFNITVICLNITQLCRQSLYQRFTIQDPIYSVNKDKSNKMLKIRQRPFLFYLKTVQHTAPKIKMPDPPPPPIERKPLRINIWQNPRRHVVLTKSRPNGRHGSPPGEGAPVSQKKFASKRNEAKQDPFARSREKKIFFSFLFASFPSNFSLPIKAKLIERIFWLCFASENFWFRFFFVLFSLHFISVSLQMRKQAIKHFFRIEAKKFRFRFASKRK